MTIAPIVTSVTVKAPPERAFELFTRHMEDWWPRGKTPGRYPDKKPHEAIVIEPKAGGRWFERDADGVEREWGKVLAWEPPGRALFGWQFTSEWVYDPDLITEVEMTFAPAPGGGTVVTLEHRNLERFGAGAEALVKSIRGGWPMHMGEFANFADSQS